MEILGVLGVLGDGSEGGVSLTTTTVTLDSIGEAAIAVANADTRSVVSMEFVEPMYYVSVLERFNVADPAAIHIRSSARDADANLNVVVTYTT